MGAVWRIRAIRVSTNSPVNHVGMAVSIEDLPPLLWHAELGRSLPDVWSGQHRRGAQLHVLNDAVRLWATRYRQRVWLRQLDFTFDRDDEDAILRTIARLDGTPFPSTAGLAKRWVRGRWRRGKRPRGEASETNEVESAYCAEIVAVTYQSVGLLPAERARGGMTRDASGVATTCSLVAAHTSAGRSKSACATRRRAASVPSRGRG